LSRFHDLTVIEVKREAEDAVSVTFEVPENLREHYAFEPGQYVPLEAEINGEAVRRTYSICCPTGSRNLRVGIRQVVGGRFSAFANQVLRRGMTLKVGKPMGRFTLAPQASHTGDYVAFVAGAGITPVLSIAATVLETERNSRFTLFYGNRNRNAIMFRDELEDLKDLYLDRFTLVHVLSQEGQDVALLHGRIDGERIKAFAQLGLFDAEETDHFFICGPGDLIDQTARALSDLGVAKQKIKREHFTPVGTQSVIEPSSPAVEQRVETREIEVRLDGAIHTVEMAPGETSIIDSAHRQGIELPYSCRGGMCCTCRAKLVEGAADMAQNYSLQPWELEAGFVLTCQLSPKSQRIVLDFDAI